MSIGCQYVCAKLRAKIITKIALLKQENRLHGDQVAKSIGQVSWSAYILFGSPYFKWLCMEFVFQVIGIWFVKSTMKMATISLELSYQKWFNHIKLRLRTNNFTIVLIMIPVCKSQTRLCETNRKERILQRSTAFYSVCQSKTSQNLCGAKTNSREI